MGKYPKPGGSGRLPLSEASPRSGRAQTGTPGTGRAVGEGPPLPRELGLGFPGGWSPLRQHLGSSLSEALTYPVIFYEQKEHQAEAQRKFGSRSHSGRPWPGTGVRAAPFGFGSRARAGPSHLAAPLGPKGPQLPRAQQGDPASPRRVAPSGRGGLCNRGRSHAKAG